MRTSSGVGERLERSWRRLSRLPGGRRIFGWLLGRLVPYSGSIRPDVLQLEPGSAVVALEDRRALRNHFGSVHAIALANVGELASGLAMTLLLPAGVRGIPIRLEIDYLKKARGRIIAEGSAVLPDIIGEDTDAFATAALRDEANDVVVLLQVTWRLSPESN